MDLAARTSATVVFTRSVGRGAPVKAKTVRKTRKRTRMRAKMEQRRPRKKYTTLMRSQYGASGKRHTTRMPTAMSTASAYCHGGIGRSSSQM